MSKSYLICWIFTRMLTIDCIPKIGHALFDPLAFEANDYKFRQESEESSDSYLSDDVPYLRSAQSPALNNTECEGYAFDQNKCKEVNGRLLCGYDKNIGETKNKDFVVDLDNGCRQRGDRIECGYVNGPFNIYPRRPPVHAEREKQNHVIRQRDAPTRTSGYETNMSPNVGFRAKILSKKKNKRVYLKNNKFTKKLYIENAISSTNNTIFSINLFDKPSNETILETTKLSMITETKVETKNTNTNEPEIVQSPKQKSTAPKVHINETKINFSTDIINSSTLLVTLLTTETYKAILRAIKTDGNIQSSTETRRLESTGIFKESTSTFNNIPESPHLPTNELTLKPVTTFEPVHKSSIATTSDFVLGTTTAPPTTMVIATATKANDFKKSAKHLVKKEFKTVCVNKRDSIFCYDIVV